MFLVCLVAVAAAAFSLRQTNWLAFVRCFRMCRGQCGKRQRTSWGPANKSSPDPAGASELIPGNHVAVID